MKLFSLLSNQYGRIETEIKQYLANTFKDFGLNYTNSSIFGQLINVLSGVVTNIMNYIEDAVTEQNKYTASRKRSIYNLAEISGYYPNLGSAANVMCQLTYMPNNHTGESIIIRNKTKCICSQNSLNYNIILQSESIVINPENNNSNKYINLVEGNFETQTFVSMGGELYSQNIPFSGNFDIAYLEVYVNDEKWVLRDSLYDMMPAEKSYICRTGLKKGVDIVFGNNEHGKQVYNGDVIKVVYLIHSGELGNINNLEECDFSFVDSGNLLTGDLVDLNNVFSLVPVNKSVISNGTFSDTAENIRNMIGMNSRSLVLADVNNYRQFFNKISFIGYTNIWVELKTLVLNAMVLKNFSKLLTNGNDYFKLSPSDFKLSTSEKNSIYSSIEASRQQLSGLTFSIIDPDLWGYALFIHVKLGSTKLTAEEVTSKIKNIIGAYFSKLENNAFVSKSDITYTIKRAIDGLKDVNLYFVSERNELAKIQGYYDDYIYEYDKDTSVYVKSTERHYIKNGEDPLLGLDRYGNISLTHNFQFPYLKANIQIKDVDNNNYYNAIPDALTVLISNNI